MDDPTYAQLFKALPKKQQQKFSHLPPTAMAEYFFILQNNAGDKEEKKRRRKGGEERKCNNPSCDKIVNRRNFCYKCQKKKERGIPFTPPTPKLPSLKQFLPSILQKEDRTGNNNLNNLPQENNVANLPSINLIINSPAFNQNSPLNNNSAPTLLPLPNNNNNINNNSNDKMKTKLLPKISPSPVSQSPSASHSHFTTPFHPTNNIPHSSSFSINGHHPQQGINNNYVFNDLASDHSMEKLHEFIVSLAGGSQEKANTLLQQYCNSNMFAAKNEPQQHVQNCFNSTPNLSHSLSQNCLFTNSFGNSPGIPQSQSMPFINSQFPMQNTSLPFSSFSVNKNTSNNISGIVHNTPPNPFNTLIDATRSDLFVNNSFKFV